MSKNLRRMALSRAIVATALLGIASSFALGGGPEELSAAWGRVALPDSAFLPPRPLAGGEILLWLERNVSATAVSEMVLPMWQLLKDWGWRRPGGRWDPLHLYVRGHAAGGVVLPGAWRVEGRRLIGPVIYLDGTAPGGAALAERLAFPLAFLSVSQYRPEEESFLTAATAEILARALRGASPAPALPVGFRAGEGSLEEREAGRSFGGAIVWEASRPGGLSGLRSLWELAAESSESLERLFRRWCEERTGEEPEALMLRLFGELAGTSLPPSARLSLAQLVAGELDASPPTAWHWRRVGIAELPLGGEQCLDIEWPEAGALALAIVFYADRALPPVSVRLGPWQRRRIPLSGVERLDLLLLGRSGPSLGRAPVVAIVKVGLLLAGLSVDSAFDGGQVKIGWSLPEEAGVAGWVVVRDEARAALLPVAGSSAEGSRYVYLDHVEPGERPHYSVWAITDDGLLAGAFRVSLP